MDVFVQCWMVQQCVHLTPEAFLLHQKANKIAKTLFDLRRSCTVRLSGFRHVYVDKALAADEGVVVSLLSQLENMS